MSRTVPWIICTYTFTLYVLHNRCLMQYLCVICLMWWRRRRFLKDDYQNTPIRIWLFALLNSALLWHMLWATFTHTFTHTERETHIAHSLTVALRYLLCFSFLLANLFPTICVAVCRCRHHHHHRRLLHVGIVVANEKWNLAHGRSKSDEDI